MESGEERVKFVRVQGCEQYDQSGTGIRVWRVVRRGLSLSECKGAYSMTSLGLGSECGEW